MPRIGKLTLVNYKSLQNVELKLNDLNILIGKNGSGKSNLISFFRLLRDAAKENLASRIGEEGGFGEIRWRGSSPRDMVEWKLELVYLEHVMEDRKEGKLTRYEGRWAAKGNGFTNRLEEISQDPYPGYSERFKYLSASDSHIQLLKLIGRGGEDKDFDYTYNDQELVVSQIRDPMRYPLLDEIRRLLDDWAIFRGFGEDALKNIYGAQSLSASYPLRLDPQGRNLVSVLQSLANEAHYAEAYGSLNEILESAFPDFEKLDLALVASNAIELRWRSRDFPGKLAFPARSMSDGMLRFIGLATLLLLPDPPSLIVIDEPEIGLHPGLIPMLAGLLKQASERTQLIVTTHSPSLLGSADIELSDIVLVERRDGATVMERADSRANLDRWLERYTLGELWTMGKLGG
jgi:predicted ATPase